MRHVLFEYAKKKQYSDIPNVPSGVYYDKQKGYWVKDGALLVSYDSDFGAVATKKHDIETGEDMKGE